jgi:beta-glucosidase
LGYEKKFGLYEVNRETLDRTPKDSAYWYRNVAVTNTVDEKYKLNIQGDSRVLDA